VNDLIEPLFKIISDHPKLALAAFVVMFLGPLLAWLRSGNNGPGRHR
jgi:hypothetical protein